MKSFEFVMSRARYSKRDILEASDKILSAGNWLKMITLEVENLGGLLLNLLALSEANVLVLSEANVSRAKSRDPCKPQSFCILALDSHN